MERALAIHTTQALDPAKLAETRFALARALWSAPTSQDRDHARARSLAEQAREAYAALGDAEQLELAKLEAWLAEHRSPLATSGSSGHGSRTSRGRNLSP